MSHCHTSEVARPNQGTYPAQIDGVLDTRQTADKCSTQAPQHARDGDKLGHKHEPHVMRASSSKTCSADADAISQTQVAMHAMIILQPPLVTSARMLACLKLLYGTRRFVRVCMANHMRGHQGCTQATLSTAFLYPCTILAPSRAVLEPHTGLAPSEKGTPSSNSLLKAAAKSCGGVHGLGGVYVWWWWWGGAACATLSPQLQSDCKPHVPTACSRPCKRILTP
jgi:hypothetical protein